MGQILDKGTYSLSGFHLQILGALIRRFASELRQQSCRIKQRPVLVLSNDVFNRKTDDIVVCAITSNLKQKDYSVLITNKDLENGELKVNSLIKLTHISTISKDIIIKSIGRLNGDTFIKVKENLKIFFSIGKIE